MTTSKLPGGLGKAVNQTLLPTETLLDEFHPISGEAIVVTDRRVLIVKAGQAAQAMFGQKIKSYPFEHITSVEVSCGLMSGRIQINVGGSSETPGHSKTLVQARQAENMIQIVRGYLARANEIAGLIETHRHAALESKTNVAPMQSDFTAQLERLAGLLERGVLTDSEFQQAKAKLLAG